MTSYLLIAVILIIVSLLQLSESRTDATSSSASSTLLDQLVQARCGPTGHAMWVYQGFLYDPVNGETIVPVQGLELIRRLPNSAAVSNDDTDNNLLEVHKQQQEMNGPPPHQHTFLTRRLFLYQDPLKSSVNNSNKDSSFSLLRAIRLRPSRPLRKIPAEQSVTVFDSATTFTVPSSSSDATTTTYDHPEWHVHTEWPNGKSLWAMAQVTLPEQYHNHNSFLASSSSTTRKSSTDTTTSDPMVVEYTIYARPGKQKPKKALTDLTKTSRSSSKSVLPPRSSLIQFGPSSPADHPKFGARETYQYTFRPASQQQQDASSGSLLPSRLWRRWTRPNHSRVTNINNPDCRVKYTRYGEGPVWYGPGRFCTLELTGRRIHQYKDVPPTVAQVAADYVPGFMSVHAPIQPTQQGRRLALKWFRESTVQVIPPLDGEDAASSEHDLFLGGLLLDDNHHDRRRRQRQRLQQWKTRWQQRALHTVQRIRAATTFSSGQNKGH